MKKEVTCPHCGTDFEVEASDYRHVSYGYWDKEVDASTFIESKLQESGLFTLYNQVRGYIVQPRLSCQDKETKIDFILSPTSKLVNAGWKGGPIGLEIKRSGLKINEPFAQTKDYARSVWRLPTGFRFMCEYFFLFPFYSTSGFMASVMAQERIGTLSHHEYNDSGIHLRFKCGEGKVLYYSFESDEIDLNRDGFGYKTGSR
jgi:hypothetical protein